MEASRSDLSESAGTSSRSNEELQRLAEQFVELGSTVFGNDGPSVDDASTRLVEAAVKRVPGAAAASITTLRHDHFTTTASTDDLATAADVLQYRLKSGPCVDAVTEDRMFFVPDVRNDHRWPEFGPRVAEELGVAGMLSFRLSVESSDVIGGLNIYATETGAFDEHAAHTGMLLATYGALLVNAAAAHTKVEGLYKALETSREIGIAVGVLMSRYKLTRDQSFSLLSIASQQTNRKVREIATEVAEIGELPAAVISKLPPPSTL